LSIAACREKLPTNVALSDQELLKRRDEMYAFAEFVVSCAPTLAAREDIAERAAIMEYDGEMCREGAEKAAVRRYLRGVQ
jgi:hypothetical protein